MSEYPDPYQVDVQLAGRFTKVRANVEYLLEHYPACRGNDLYLTWLYWRIWNKIDLPRLDFDLFYKMEAPETITRRRREIQNDSGRYLPSEKVLMSRERKARRGKIG